MVTRKEAVFIGIVVIVILGALVVGYCIMPTKEKIEQQETKIVEPTVMVTTVIATTNTACPVVITTSRMWTREIVPCVQHPRVFLDLPWGSLYDLDIEQVTQLQFFDGCEYQNISSSQIASAEGYVDNKIRKYEANSLNGVSIKNWSFRKIIYIDRDVKIMNNTVVNPYSGKAYVQILDDPMSNDNGMIYLYYFHNSNGVIAVGWGNEKTGVLLKNNNTNESTSPENERTNNEGPSNDQVSGFPGGPANDEV